jgi:hypothetical protein
MARLLYGLLGINIAWLIACIVGIAVDAPRLDFWSQGLLWGLLGVLVLAPVAVFGARRPVSPSPAATTASATPSSARLSRSWGRLVTYALSAVIGLWFFVSLFSLFLFPDRFELWSTSLLAAFLALVMWTPVVVFVYNPMNDPKVAAGPDAAAPGDAEAPPAFVPDAVRESAVPDPQRRKAAAGPAAQAGDASGSPDGPAPARDARTGDSRAGDDAPAEGAARPGERSDWVDESPPRRPDDSESGPAWPE